MRVLVVGGGRFVGRHMVAEAVARGHDVTVLHRGRTCGGWPAQARHLHFDRDGALDVLAEGHWEATIDVCAYRPEQVLRLARALDGRGGHVTFVSTVSVYAPPAAPGANEDAPRIALDGPDPREVTDKSYGGLKARCEDAAQGAFGPGTLIVRPTYVVGPGDHTGRFTYWVLRLAEGGDVLAPGPRDGPVQLVDARDLAAFVWGLVVRRAAGVLHAATPAPPFGFGDMLEAIAAEVAPAGTRLAWVDLGFLRASGVDGQSLPLWGGDEPDRFVLALDPARALAAGLRPRALRETIRDTLVWARSTPSARVTGVGLGPARERELLASWAKLP